jgi:hypothetical protein
LLRRPVIGFNKQNVWHLEISFKGNLVDLFEL